MFKYVRCKLTMFVYDTAIQLNKYLSIFVKLLIFLWISASGHIVYEFKTRLLSLFKMITSEVFGSGIGNNFSCFNWWCLSEVNINIKICSLCSPAAIFLSLNIHGVFEKTLRVMRACMKHTMFQLVSIISQMLPICKYPWALHSATFPALRGWYPYRYQEIPVYIWPFL